MALTRTFALVAAVVLVLGPTALAATYYVDRNHPSASDTNPGTEDQPWLTVGKAAGSTAVGPGDTVIVKQGIYRERASISRSGVEGNPVTYKANPGDRVILAGSEEITGWQELPEGMARGNPYYENIYYVDLGYEPLRIDEDEVKMQYAREPDQGWWVVGTGSDPTHVVDPVHLTQPDSNYWVGADLFFVNLQPVQNQSVGVTAYDPGTHTVTVDGSLATSGDSGPQAGTDLYYMYNKLELMDHPGEMVLEDLGGGSYRLYVWPSDGGNANNHLYEGTTETRHVLSWGTAHHVVIDGFEVRHCAGYGQGLGERISGGAHHITVQNCTVRACQYKGICASGCDNLTVRNCLSFDNGYGVTVGNGTDILIEECDIHSNTVDGIVASHGVYDLVVRRCFVHDHFLWGHPDNLQTHNGVYNMWVEDCVVLNSGQSHMIEGTDGLHYINTIVAGCSGWMLHGGASNQEVRDTTLAYSGYGLMTLGHDGYTFRNNVFYRGHGNVLWGADSSMQYDSDYNLLYHAPGVGGAIINWGGSWLNFSSYVSTSGYDTHSLNVDPQFVNAPVYYEQMDHYEVPNYTSTRVYLADHSLFDLGDHIEINFDGVVRSVTGKGGSTGSEWIEYTPATDGPVLKSGVVANWKTNTDYAIDLRLRPTSPAIGAGETGGDLGSDLSIPEFRQGDLDGDGLRDVPAWPPGGSPSQGITRWDVVSTHGPLGDLAVEAEPHYVEPRAAGALALRATCSVALDPATVVPGAVTITGESGGDVSAMISCVGPAEGDTVIVIDLSAALPDADRYAVALSDTVRAADGTEIGGAMSRQFATLAGDVDGSGWVSAADVLALRGHPGEAVTAETAPWDVDGSGAVTGGDLRAVRSNLGHSLP